MQSQKQCCVIVLNYNGKELLRSCLHSLLQQTHPHLSVVVVDNGSSDGSIEMLAQDFMSVRAIALPENRGFSIANNIAMREVLTQGFEYVMLLNNDTIVDSECVETLLASMYTDTKIAAVCPKIYFASRPDVLWYAGADFNLSSARLVQRGWKQKDTGQFDHHVDITVITGCAVLLRASALKDAGPLDETLWAYLEDVEWSIRFLRKGYKLRFVPEARVWHHDGATWVHQLSGGSAAKRQFLSTRNMVLLGWKHVYWWQFPTYLLGFLFFHVLFYTALRIFRQDYEALWAVYRGIGSSLQLIGEGRWREGRPLFE